MPRIDPLQLINCLQVLLSPTGGILSNHEVHRLVSLMTKFSKKLVSKCVYVLILKNTESSLLDSFMNAGGWTLIQLWLHDGMYSTNWALVKELLELLLITPVDVERLKSNNIPKLVKSLSKRDDLAGIHELSSQLVQQWLKIVKGETTTEVKVQPVMPVPTQEEVESSAAEVPTEEAKDPVEEAAVEEGQVVAAESTDGSISTQTFYKVTLKDGKHLISKVDPSEANCEVVTENTGVVEEKQESEVKEEVKKEEEEEKKEEKKKSHDKSRRSSKSSSTKDRGKNSSSSHRDKDRRSSSSSSGGKSSNKDKDRSKDKREREKDRHSRSNGSIKSSSKSSSKDKEKKKDPKEKQAEKDKDTLAKIQPQSLEKLPKIPKKSTDDKNKEVKESATEPPKKEEPKKGTISIEVRKSTEERPKTVKVYKSKMRSTGLEEEAKPAPPRPIKKPVTAPPVVIPPVPLKRSSPIKDLGTVPPEKKIKIETPLERPGAIKLIPPKPKPPVLQESDMFMDALTASATTKKEPKKRKRRTSVSKDSSGSSPPPSPSTSTTNSASSPIGLKNIAPPKFYQDTLEAEEAPSDSQEDKENVEAPKTEEPQESDRATTPTDTMEEMDAEPVTKNTNGLKGVLVYIRRKGPKKSIKWKPDEELVDIQYFELDETERVNVTKTFGDMAKMDLRSEREALQLSRKLTNEDVMDVQTLWRIPMDIDLPESLAAPGSKSLEKDIQFAREKSVLQSLYFNKKMVPDSPAEPDPENYQIKDPVVIPIDDVENPEHDFRNKPWPEPKGSPPPQNVPNSMPPMFNPNMPINFQNFTGTPPPNFNMPPNFNGPPFMPPNVGEWNNMPPNMPPNMHNPQMMPNNMGPPDMMNQGPVNPNMFMQPPENFNPMMNDGNHRFPPPFNQHQQGPPGMFPPNNFPNRGGFGGFRRGGGNGPWVRMNGPNPGGWNNMRGGAGGHRGGRLCNNVRNKGFCRNRDTCPFFHPNN